MGVAFGAAGLTVEAELAAGFDPAWLRNAVLEPLEEADVVEERGRGVAAS